MKTFRHLEILLGTDVLAMLERWEPTVYKTSICQIKEDSNDNIARQIRFLGESVSLLRLAWNCHTWQGFGQYQ